MNREVKKVNVGSSLEAVAADYEARAGKNTLRIGVIGLGYVGLPLVEAFVRAGLSVVGFDVDDRKVQDLSAGRSYIKHIPDSRVAEMNRTKRFSATVDFKKIADVDAVLIAVPTPLNEHREPDLTYVVKTTESIAQHLRPNQLVVLESTTYPGTCDEVIIPILQRGGLKAGEDFAVAYSPEREDPGNPHFETSTIPKVVGANSPAERRMAIAVYDKITKTVPVSDTRTAEAVKLTENIFRLINIASVNELKKIFGAMDINVWEVIDAAKTKPFGFMAFYPGPGLGGHCIPIDPFYLTWKARAFGEQTRFIELAGDVVTQLPRLVVEAVTEGLSSRMQKAVSGARILVVGLAYKKNIDDMRESPSLHLMYLLKKRGAQVDYYDPYIPIVPVTHDHPEFAGLKSVEWSKDALKQYDCALISTDHDGVDYRAMLESIPVVVDTRNATAEYMTEFGAKIIRA